MKKIVIFANGTEWPLEKVVRLAAEAAVIICADGGAEQCRQLGVIPDLIVGDLDSMASPCHDHFTSLEVEIHRHPARKEATDLDLALNEALKLTPTEISIVGGLGGRWDMSIANIMLAASPRLKGCRITLLGDHTELHVLHPGPPHPLPSARGKTVSLIPLNGPVEGITLQGFEYPLLNHRLEFGSTRGVSNIVTTDAATITQKTGVLLCVVSPLFPER